MGTMGCYSQVWNHKKETSLTRILHYCLLLLQISSFRVPCRSGMCSTPMEVTSSQLISSEIFPLPLVKAMLYPGAVANGLITSRTVPSWDNLLNIYNLTNVKEASAVTDLQRLEEELVGVLRMDQGNPDAPPAIPHAEQAMGDLDLALRLGPPSPTKEALERELIQGRISRDALQAS
ncbi:hypothetical protein H5410_030562 [Solanum commersonii]|uniref:Uncharacterized protein n=1 Tax=Solanum commersonii TaxID=4109 RepID=A0A9J5YHQ9_SOLCO|nr:hypothetical protein H5410_030562 [Solanum commersonii]